MPYLTSETFKGNKWLKNQHAETIIPALFRKIVLPYTRERITLTDGDFLDLDWLCSGNTRLLVLFHGLEGSSQSQYIKGMASLFYKHGFDICAVNFRSCSGEMNNLLRSYHSGATEDIDAVMQYIISLNSYQRIVAGGFSLGGNVLLKYLGEQKFVMPKELVAGFAFSVPVDLKGSAQQMAKWQNKIYMNRFLKSLNQKMMYKATQFKGQLNIKGINQIHSFHDFDSRFTGPIHGFKDADDYYKQCNSLQFLPTISIPTLLVNAYNDPFLSASCFPQKHIDVNPNLFALFPQYGGHVGFSQSLPNGPYWSEIQAYSFIENQLLIK